MTAELFGTDWCGYCARAKKLLAASGIAYDERIVDEDISIEALSERVGKPVKTVPQIFLDGEYIGGFAELQARLNPA